MIERCDECGHIQWRPLLFWRWWVGRWCIEVHWLAWQWKRWNGPYLAFSGRGEKGLTYGVYGPLTIEKWGTAEPEA